MSFKIQDCGTVYRLKINLRILAFKDEKGLEINRIYCNMLHRQFWSDTISNMATFIKIYRTHFQDFPSRFVLFTYCKECILLRQKSAYCHNLRHMETLWAYFTQYLLIFQNYGMTYFYMIIIFVSNSILQFQNMLYMLYMLVK